MSSSSTEPVPKPFSPEVIDQTVAMGSTRFHGFRPCRRSEIKCANAQDRTTGVRRFGVMKTFKRLADQAGGAGSYGLLWLLGVPRPILLIIYLVRGH
jgi:hypothetical protein